MHNPRGKMGRHERARRFAAAPSIAFLLLALQTAIAQTEMPKPPPTRQDNFREVIHGVEIVDPYRWLEEQESPETRAWIDAQNRYTHTLLDGLPSVRGGGYWRRRCWASCARQRRRLNSATPAASA